MQCLLFLHNIWLHNIIYYCAAKLCRAQHQIQYPKWGIFTRFVFFSYFLFYSFFFLIFQRSKKQHKGTLIIGAYTIEKVGTSFVPFLYIAVRWRVLVLCIKELRRCATKERFQKR
jgi:hypothetical protein